VRIVEAIEPREVYVAPVFLLSAWTTGFNGIRRTTSNEIKHANTSRGIRRLIEERGVQLAAEDAGGFSLLS
jgi:hypothetical protein